VPPWAWAAVAQMYVLALPQHTYLPASWAYCSISLSLWMQALQMCQAVFSTEPNRVSLHMVAHSIFMRESCFASPKVLFSLGFAKQRMHEDEVNSYQSCHLQQMVCG